MGRGCGGRQNVSSVCRLVARAAVSEVRPYGATERDAVVGGASGDTSGWTVMVVSVIWCLSGRVGGVVGVGVDGLAGEGQEDLVEGGSAQSDVVDGEVALVEQPHEDRKSTRLNSSH